MSQVTTSKIDTLSNTTPLVLTTANNLTSVTIFPANSTVAISATQFVKNGVVVAGGKKMVWIPATQFSPRLTNGPASGQYAMATSGVNYKTYDFDPATIETVDFDYRFPKSWDKGTITFIPVVSQTTTSAGSTLWNVSAVAISSSDVLDVSIGTPQTVLVSQGSANTLYIGAESSPVTIAGSPQEGDIIHFAVNRYATSGSDTLAIDGRLHGVTLIYNANTDTDT
jgi:hypothetical protein